MMIMLPISALGAVAPTTSLKPTISALPSYQTPGGNVRLTAIANVPQGIIFYTWSVDGVEITSGLDVASLTINAGAAGSSKRVAVSLLDTTTGIEGGAVYIVRPAAVDLLWEGNTYVPAFYPGKAFPTGESSIVIEAVPYVFADGVRVSKNDLVYEWAVGGKKMLAESGYGKSTLRVPVTRFKNSTSVSVIASTADGIVGARTSITVPHRAPRVVAYEEKPLSGTWFTQAVSSPTQMLGDELAFRAVPFFVINPKSIDYAWTLNGSPFEVNPSDPSIAVFRKAGDGEGRFPVSVTIQKQGSIFERASAGFDLSF